MGKSQPGVDKGWEYPVPRVEWILDGSDSFQRALFDRVLGKLIEMRNHGHICLTADEHQMPDGRLCRKYVFWIDED